MGSHERFLHLVALLVFTTYAHRDGQEQGHLEKDAFLSSGSHHVSSFAGCTSVELSRRMVQSLTGLADTFDSWTKGIVICFAGNTIRALGLVLQKHSHYKSAPDTCYLTQSWWLIGFALFLSSQILNAVAMPMAPQVVLSCIGTWSIVVTPFCAWAILGEKLQGIDLAATLGVCAGLAFVIAGTAASKFQATADVDVLVGQMLALQVLAVVVVQAALLALLHFHLCRLRPSLEPVSWALIAALSSGPSVILSKCVMTLLIEAPATDSGSPWSRPEPWFFLLSAAALMALLTHSLARGLQTGSAVQVLPVYYAAGMTSQILMAVVAFKEIEEFPEENSKHMLFIGAGVLLLLLCTVALSSSADRREISGKAEGS